jgi:pilus assembly protein CpaB
MILLAFVALGLSVLVAFLAYRMLRNRLDPPSAEMAQIVVAAEKLSLGERLKASQLKIAPWPRASMPEGSFFDPKEIEGRGVVVPITANEPVLESKLASKEAGAGLTSVIPEGMRAVAVKVNDVIGVAGFVLPGTRVDVMIIGSPDQRGTQMSKVFLENVQVLAAGQNVQQDVDGKPQNVQVVTMLVTPEDAQKLALASADSRIQLALRNPIDLEQVNPPGVQKDALYGRASTLASLPQAEQPRPRRAAIRYAPRRPAPRPEVAAAPPPPVVPAVTRVQVEVIHRDKRETATFEKQP